MDLIEETAAAYLATAKMATFIMVHQPTHEAYLKSINPKPTKNDRERFIKEMETLRMFGEEMEKEVRLMMIPKEMRHGEGSTRETNR